MYLDLKSKYPISNNWNHNGYECIENFVNIADKYIPKQYETSTKELKSLSFGH